MLMRDKVVAAGQHILQGVRAAELLVAAVIDQPLVQAGHLADMLVTMPMSWVTWTSVMPSFLFKQSRIS